MSTGEVSVAVMPFRNLSSEPDTEYFANGFVEDLTAELVRFPSLRVLATQSAFGVGRTRQAAADVAGEWNLDFVLEGSVRRGAASLRVGVQLIRVESRETVWADRFDTPLESVFAIQDKIVATVAGRLAVHMDEARLRESRRQATESLAAYDCWLRGMDCLRRGTLEGDEESRQFFERALQIDPEYARATPAFPFRTSTNGHARPGTCGTKVDRAHLTTHVKQQNSTTTTRSRTASWPACRVTDASMNKPTVTPREPGT